MKVRMSEFVNTCKTVDISSYCSECYLYKYWNRNIGPANQGPKTDITGTHI